MEKSIKQFKPNDVTRLKNVEQIEKNGENSSNSSSLSFVDLEDDIVRKGENRGKGGAKMSKDEPFLSSGEKKDFSNFGGKL